MKETRERIWKQQNKHYGKKSHYPKLKGKGSTKALDEKLKKIEVEIKVYKEELKKAETEKEKRETQINRRNQKFGTFNIFGTPRRVPVAQE